MQSYSSSCSLRAIPLRLAFTLPSSHILCPLTSTLKNKKEKEAKGRAKALTHADLKSAIAEALAAHKTPADKYGCAATQTLSYSHCNNDKFSYKAMSLCTSRHTQHQRHCWAIPVMGPAIRLAPLRALCLGKDRRRRLRTLLHRQ